MDLTEQDQKDLLKFETLKKKDDEVQFDQVKVSDLGKGGKIEFRRIPVPKHRYTPLKQSWDSILKVLVEHMKLQVRVNTKRRQIEMRTSEATEDVSSI
jgi:RNA-binding protein PNO1